MPDACRPPGPARRRHGQSSATISPSTYDFGACAMQASRAAIHAEAEHHIFDELKDWIDARPDWDGVARLDGWLTTYAGADPKAHTAEYLALIGSKYIMQVLNRALNPGAKADYSLALRRPPGGRQGPRARGDVRALLPRGCSVTTSQPGRLRPWYCRGDRRARRRDVGLAQVRRRRAEGGADPLRRPWPAALTATRRAPIRGAPASPSRATMPIPSRTRPAIGGIGPST